MHFHKELGRAGLFTPSQVGLVLLSVVCALAVVMLQAPTVIAESVNGPVVKLTVTADGQEWEWVSCQPTVGGILQEAGVTLGPKDRVHPSLNVKSTQGMRIRITRVEEKVVVQKEPIGFRTITKFNPYGIGSRRVIQEGEQGEKEVKYLVTCKDGVKIGARVLEARVMKQPVNEVVAVSKAAFLASRSGSHYRSLRMIATAYAPFFCGGSRTGRAACGMQAGYGIVAVDPRVIPLGTQLYVEGYGFCVAGDTGGAIKGSRIDLGFGTYGEAIRFGRRAVTVYILD